MRTAELHRLGLAGQYGLYSLAIIAGLTSSLTTLAQPIVVGLVISSMMEQNPYGGLVALLISVFLVGMVVSVASQLALGRVSERYVMNLRNAIALKVMYADWRSLHRYDKGDVISRVAVDTALARGWLVGAVPQLTSAVLLVLGCAIGMAVISLPLFLASFTCIAVFGGLSIFFSRGVKTATVKNQEDTAVFIESLHRVITNIVVLKTAVLEKIALGRVADGSEMARRSGVRAIDRSALLGPTMNIGTQAAIALTVVLGGALAATDTLSAAALVTYFMYLLYIVAPLIGAASAFGEIASSRAALQRLREISDVPQELEGEKRVEKQCVSRLDLRDVGIEIDGQPILDEISIVLSGPGLIALTGPNGSGKSTLLWTLNGLYRPDHGSINYNGLDINQISTTELRKDICLIPQNPAPLIGTVRDNLQTGESLISDEDRWHALRTVGLENRVRSLPGGLSCALGEGGVELSGGQRQLLALARGLLGDPSIFLLDEFTAYVDKEGEMALNSVAIELAKTKLVVVVSHREEIVHMSDRILQLGEGRMVTTGSSGLSRSGPFK